MLNVLDTIKNFGQERYLDAKEMLDISRLNRLLGRKEAEEIQEKKKAKTWVIVLAVIGGIAIIGAAAYFLYRYFKPDYLEDFEDDFEDDDEDDDDVFEDEGEE